MEAALVGCVFEVCALVVLALVSCPLAAVVLTLADVADVSLFCASAGNKKRHAI